MAVAAGDQDAGRNLLEIGLALLEVATGWNGLKGAAFTVLGASALSVMGFWVAIISLSQITITVKPKPELPPRP